MRLFGEYRIKDGKVYPVFKNEIIRPYYTIDRRFTSFTGSEDFTLAPSRIAQPYILNSIMQAKADDGLMLWLLSAPDENWRVCRSLCEGCLVFQVGMNGSVASIIAPRDRESKVAFIDAQHTTCVFKHYTKSSAVIESTLTLDPEMQRPARARKKQEPPRKPRPHADR